MKRKALAEPADSVSPSKRPAGTTRLARLMCIAPETEVSGPYYCALDIELHEAETKLLDWACGFANSFWNTDVVQQWSPMRILSSYFVRKRVGATAVSWEGGDPCIEEDFSFFENLREIPEKLLEELTRVYRSYTEREAASYDYILRGYCFDSNGEKRAIWSKLEAFFKLLQHKVTLEGGYTQEDVDFVTSLSVEQWKGFSVKY